MKLSELTTASKFFESLAVIDQELPFKLFPKLVKSDRTQSVAGFELPTIRSLTVGEELAYQEYLNNHHADETPILVGQMVLATLLLRSRYDADWTLEQTYVLNVQAITDLFTFFLAERNPEPAAEAEAEPEPEAPPAKKPRSTTRKSSGTSSEPSPVTSDSEPPALELALSES